MLSGMGDGKGMRKRDGERIKEVGTYRIVRIIR
jgi:hypothetical protein